MATRHADELEGLSRSEILRASPRMFESKLLEKVSRVHPAVPPILFGPTIVFMLVEGFIHGAGWLTPAWLVGGYLFWTLTEYWLHRIVFHFEPEQGLGARLHWMIHGVHHDHPNDPRRLVLPPAFSIPLALLFLCAGAAGAALPIGPAGAAAQVGAGAAALVASGAGASQALAAAISVGALGVVTGAAILLFAVAWRTGSLLLAHTDG
jgi:sterol desaturase/sphingolipid hydroxylase (fatty acid hydroxylase superfamily)